MDMKLLRTAVGKVAADIVVKNGKIVNVCSGEIYDGGVAVSGGKIAAVGDVDYTIGESTEVIDANGNFITPGFVDAHIHPESSNLSIRPFAEIVLKHGTTSIMADYHEIGVVGGMEAVEAIIAESKETDLNIGFVVPSQVPFYPELETTKGIFDPKTIAEALRHPDAVGINEAIGPYILDEYPDLVKSIDETLSHPGYTVQGAMPEMVGKELSACLAVGVSTDHEMLTGEETLQRMRGGCHVLLRESSMAHNLHDCIRPIIDRKLDTTYASLVADDIHTIDLVELGHMDGFIRLALKEGMGFLQTIQMCTINPARAYDKHKEIGSLSPGRRADINITTGPDDFKVLSVISGGKLVCENEKLLVSYPKATHKPCLLNTAKLKNPITADSFKICVDDNAKSAKVRVMETNPAIYLTTERIVELPVIDGVVQCDVEQDVLYVAQVERYGINGNVGKAFMGGFGFRHGAIASSVGHDNHNVIVLGTSFADMAVAVNRVVEMGGGQLVVNNGEVVAEVALPICGLMSDLSAEELVKKKRKLLDIIHSYGSTVQYPYMLLTYLCLIALPDLSITDHGLICITVDYQYKAIDPIVEIYK